MMQSLNEVDLSKARRYINSSPGRNPISTVMELGQLLHIKPEFITYEAETSTTHLHVFICDAVFANLKIQAKGYNKKRVKTEAASKMVELFAKESDNYISQQDVRPPRTQVQIRNKTPSLPHRFRNNLQADISIHEKEPVKSAARKLGEFCLLSKEFGLPKFVFDEECIFDSQEKYTATVTVPSTPYKFSCSSSTKDAAQQLAAEKMLMALSQIPDEQTVSESKDLLTGLKNLNIIEDEKSSKLNVKSTILDALKKISLNGEQKASLKQKKSALEILTEISNSERFHLQFHDVEGSGGSSYLSLLEAKIGPGLVTHGIADNKLQARENAADSLLSVIKFLTDTT